MNQNFDIIVIGGGAAGFFSAINIVEKNPKLKVGILERGKSVLEKVRISGGGRCNVTHAVFEPNELVKNYPRGEKELRGPFHKFCTNETIDWFQNHGVPLKTEVDGRMFPQSNSSQTIIDCLLGEAKKYNVEILTSCEVAAIEISNSIFQLQTSNQKNINATFLCIASGGYPKALQFQWLQKLGHSIEMPVPSLFTFNMPNNNITSLMGVTVENAQVKIAGTKLVNEGPLLITHWGMSGPAILKLSAYGARVLAEKNYEFSIIINWITNYTEQSLREQWIKFREQYAAQKISNKN